MLTRRTELQDIYSLLTCSAHSLLSHWFESEPLKATLLTDGLIGAMVSPHAPSTSYVLLHHVMGGVEGKRGAWAYPEGGMGGVTQALARSARSHKAHLFTDQVSLPSLTHLIHPECGHQNNFHMVTLPARTTLDVTKHM